MTFFSSVDNDWVQSTKVFEINPGMQDRKEVVPVTHETMILETGLWAPALAQYSYEDVSPKASTLCTFCASFSHSLTPRKSTRSHSAALHRHNVAVAAFRRRLDTARDEEARISAMYRGGGAVTGESSRADSIGAASPRQHEATEAFLLRMRYAQARQHKPPHHRFHPESPFRMPSPFTERGGTFVPAPPKFA